MTAIPQVSGIGSWPGDSLHVAAQEIVSVLGALPFLPQLPQRAGEDMISAVMRDDPGHTPWLIPDVCLSPTVQVPVCGPNTLAAATGMSINDAVAHLLQRIPRWLAQLPSGVAWQLQIDEPVAHHAESIRQVMACHDGPTLLHTCACTPDMSVITAIAPDAVALDLCRPEIATQPIWIESVRRVHTDTDTQVWAGVVPTAGEIPAHVPDWVLSMHQQRPIVFTPACGLGLSADAMDRLRAVRNLAEHVG